MMNKDDHKKNFFTTTLWDLDHPLTIKKNIPTVINIGSKSTMTMMIFWDPEKLCAFESL